jgi:hypothetical protein
MQKLLHTNGYIVHTQISPINTFNILRHSFLHQNITKKNVYFLIYLEKGLDNSLSSQGQKRNIIE